MNKKDYSNTIDRQIRKLDELVESQTKKCFDRNELDRILPYETAESIKRVIMTGCGSSFSAAGAMAEAFRRISGIKAVHHPDPMEFTRYYSDFDLTKGYDCKETLVVAIGTSGESRMIREILEKERNCYSVLITNDPDPLNKEYAESLFLIETPERCDTRDLRSYFAGMIALLGLASHLGKANGHFTETQEEELITEIRDYVHNVMKEYERIDEQMFMEAQKMKDIVRFDLVGDWSDHWTALLVEQKLIECSGVQATHTNSEEWVHISMMNKDPEQIGTIFIITSGSNSYGRITDTSWGAVRLGRPTIVVTDGNREDFEEELTFVSLPKAPQVYLAPLMNFIPGALLAGYHAAINNKDSINDCNDCHTQEQKTDQGCHLEKAYNKFYYQGTFRTQCLDVGPLTMIQFDRSVESVKTFISDPVFQKTKRIISEGCGDSNLVGPAVREAFHHYLPDIDFEPMEALDLSRYYDYSDQGEETVVIAVSVSGRIHRTNECLTRANNHGMTTIAMTDSRDSECARRAKYLYHTDTPAGDNNAGLRSYFANCLSLIIFAAALAEVRDGKEYLPELRRQVQAYHDAFYGEIEAIDDKVFATAINWKKQNRRLFEMVADGPLQAAAQFVAAKFAEVPGEIIAVIDSENYRHVNALEGPAEAYAEMAIIDSHGPNVEHIVETINSIVRDGHREMLVFADKDPKELGITEKADYCHIHTAPEEYRFLTPLYAYIPASILTCYRATSMGEVMFRGGFYLEIFDHSYWSKEVIIDE